MQMANLLKNANNPNAVLQQLVQTNPQVQQAMNYINQNGGDPKAAFYKLAQEKGVDPNLVLNSLR